MKLHSKYKKSLILFVDDDPDFRSELTPRLQTCGYEVVEAEDGETGLKKAEELTPNLIVTNVKMPKMDGVQMMLRLKENPKTKAIPVFLLTAFGDPEPKIYARDLLDAKKMGFSDYMVKIFPLDDIIERIVGLGRSTRYRKL